MGVFVKKKETNMDVFLDGSRGLNGHEKSYFYWLEEFVQKVKPKKILQIGTGWAVSTIAFTRKTKAVVTTIDKIPHEKLELYQERIALFPELRSRIVEIDGDSVDVLTTLPKHEYDIVYIDGDHTYHGAKNDFDNSADKVKRPGYLLCDDVLHYLNFIHRNPEKAEKGHSSEFGVTRALCEWCQHNGKDFKIIARANGFGVVKLDD